MGEDVKLSIDYWLLKPDVHEAFLYTQLLFTATL